MIEKKPDHFFIYFDFFFLEPLSIATALAIPMANCLWSMYGGICGSAKASASPLASANAYACVSEFFDMFNLIEREKFYKLILSRNSNFFQRKICQTYDKCDCQQNKQFKQHFYFVFLCIENNWIKWWLQSNDWFDVMIEIDKTMAHFIGPDFNWTHVKYRTN